MKKFLILSLCILYPTFNKAEKKLNGTFDYQGNVVFFESITEGDSMTGTVSVGGMSFPLKASRKK